MLKILDLSDNMLTGTILISFKNLSSLSALYLGDNMLNGTLHMQGNNLKSPVQLFFVMRPLAY